MVFMVNEYLEDTCLIFVWIDYKFFHFVFALSKLVNCLLDIYHKFGKFMDYLL